MSKRCSTIIAIVVALSTWLSATAAVPYIQIMPRPPKDLASRAASQEDLAKFAWQEFLALNWKASVDSTHAPGPSNQRGLPDLAWSYSKPAPQFPNPLVWQTYAQTTELRPNLAGITTFGITSMRTTRLVHAIFMPTTTRNRLLKSWCCFR